MNFGRNFTKFADFGHVRNFFSNEFQNPGSNCGSGGAPAPPTAAGSMELLLNPFYNFLIWIHCEERLKLFRDRRKPLLINILDPPWNHYKEYIYTWKQYNILWFCTRYEAIWNFTSCLYTHMNEGHHVSLHVVALNAPKSTKWIILDNFCYT